MSKSIALFGSTFDGAVNIARSDAVGGDYWRQSSDQQHRHSRHECAHDDDELERDDDVQGADERNEKMKIEIIFFHYCTDDVFVETELSTSPTAAAAAAAAALALAALALAAAAAAAARVGRKR